MRYCMWLKRKTAMTDYYDDYELILKEEAEAFAMMDGNSNEETISFEPEEETTIPAVQEQVSTGTDGKVVQFVPPVQQGNTSQVSPPQVQPVQKTKKKGAKTTQGNFGQPKILASPTEFITDFIEKADLFLNEEDVAFATIKINGVDRDYPVHSQKFQKILKVEAYQGSSGMPSEYELRDAAGFAEGLAYHRNKVLPVHTRFNFNGDRLVLDLCNEKGEIVYLDRNGWSVCAKEPHKFLQPTYMKALPRPDKENGSIEPLFNLLNLKNPLDIILIIVWIISALDTTVERPILCFHGAAGSGKSTFAHILKTLIDPSKLDLLSIGDNERDIGVQLQGNAIVPFDNEVSLSKKVQNLLCRIVTGGSSLRRQLFTNGDPFSVGLKRAVIMTGIEIPYTAGDLMDRTLAVELKRISSDERQSKNEILKQLEAHRAVILSGILTIFQKALVIRDTLNPKKMPRMADFYRIGCAVAEAIGFGEEQFTAAMNNSIRKGYEFRTETQPLPAVIASSLEQNYQAYGIAEETLCAELWFQRALTHAPTINVDVRELPKSSSAFTRKIRTQYVDMEHLGWQMTISDDARKCREITFTRIA